MGDAQVEVYESEIRGLRQQLEERMPDVSVDVDLYEKEIHSLKQQLETGLHEVCSLREQLKEAKSAQVSDFRKKKQLRLMLQIGALSSLFLHISISELSLIVYLEESYEGK